MASQSVLLTGKLPKLKHEDARRVAVYLVRGSEILAQSDIDHEGRFKIDLMRHTAKQLSAYGLDLVVGPKGMSRRLHEIPQLQRVNLDIASLDKAELEFVVSLEKVKINEEILKLWWVWCEWYCVSGTLRGLDGCPVPGADVTVYTVFANGMGGFTKTPRATVTTDLNGNFTVCFAWCTCLFCWPCWPCWPWWWLCWPWWWEWDILHALEEIERVPQIGPIPPGPLDLQRGALTLSRPSAKDLMRGQGFQTALRTETPFAPDPQRTALVKRKFADPRIRALFPWWWWCCDDPNIVFSATQNGNTILDENPATDTRWCLEENSNVTLIANGLAIGNCPGGPRPAQGFVWTRVGNVLVSDISGGYANGAPGNDASDMAFAGGLDIYGEFAVASGVAYYQVNVGQWSGDPSRGGTAPGSISPLALPLYNHVVLQHPNPPFITVEKVMMGPLNGTNLYSTQEQRPSASAALLPPFPVGTVMGWAFNGRKVDAEADSLIASAGVGGVTLSITGYDAAMNPLALPSNPDDHLTLEIDDTPLTLTQINSLSVFDSNGNPVGFSGTGDCPAYNIHLGGYVKINVTVTDNNGHLYEYEVLVNHGAGVTDYPAPGLRGYATQGNLAQKSWLGTTEDYTFYPTVSCCYEFELWVGKRVTDGENGPGLYRPSGAFRTATINVT